MVSNKRSVARMVDILGSHGMKDVIFSPGSRNAPLIISFNEDKRFKCTLIHDERVAGFFAMGIAQYTGQPVVLSCTSGSAVYNYAPAIAEAFYQGIPLIICTADRPIEWVDQGDGQTIRQRDIFKGHIKQSFEFIQETDHPDELWYNDRIVNEAILCAQNRKPGPVHLNIPLREPIYDVVGKVESTKIIEHIPAQFYLAEKEWNKLTEDWNSNRKRLVIVGQNIFRSESIDGLIQLVKDRNLVAMTETTSNVSLPFQVACIDRTIEGIGDDFASYQPDLLITIGGEIVSKKVKALFRRHKPKKHWHLDKTTKVIDTFQCLTKIIEIDPHEFFGEVFLRSNVTGDTDFKDAWVKLFTDRKKKANQFLSTTEWSDLKVFKKLLNTIPSDSLLHLANSTPIRYSQLFDSRSDLTYYANRGTSGIDGSTSTAAGMAYASDKLTTIITGDTSFFYDSNALWIRDLPKNLRIIIVNNGGGNIFRIIPGPDSTNQLEDFFEAAHEHSGEGLASTYGLPYFECNSESKLDEILETFFASQFEKTPILEIHTPQLVNDKVLKRYFDYITS